MMFCIFICNFGDKDVEIQTMKNVFRKSAHKILICGPI